MKKRIRGTTASIETAARRMRVEPTGAEAVLWEALRKGKIRGFQFRRQHPVGRFIFDFYCAACKLVIEVDGDYHLDEDQRARDDARTAMLELWATRSCTFGTMR